MSTKLKRHCQDEWAAIHPQQRQKGLTSDRKMILSGQDAEGNSIVSEVYPLFQGLVLFLLGSY